MQKKAIGSAAFVVIVLALAAVMILWNRSDRQKTAILIGVPAGQAESTLEADFTLSKALEDAAEQNTVTFALLNAEPAQQAPAELGQADAVIWMSAEGRPEAPFQHRSFVWLAQDDVLVKTDSGQLCRITGTDAQALAAVVSGQIAPYAQPRTD